MASVTQRIKQITQPYGGYLPTKFFNRTQLKDNRVLSENENIHGSNIGIAVDYLTRFMLGESAKSAFEISLLGAEKIKQKTKATSLLSQIKGLDDSSIINACKLSGYDVCFRASPIGYKPVEQIKPNADTVSNIRIMVERSLHFFKIYGPLTVSGFTFEGGYTQTVTAGDGDFCTKNTMWDFKVSKRHITPAHTLQILMYYIMGLHSIHPFFKEIKNLGFFNPRLNIVYSCPISSIPQSTISDVSSQVIGYKTPKATKVDNAFQPPKLHKSTNSDLTVKEVCDTTKLTKTEIHRAIKFGFLRAYIKSGEYYIPQYDLDNYLQRKKSLRRSAIFIAVLLIIILLITLSKS